MCVEISRLDILFFDDNRIRHRHPKRTSKLDTHENSIDQMVTISNNSCCKRRYVDRMRVFSVVSSLVLVLSQNLYCVKSFSILSPSTITTSRVLQQQYVQIQSSVITARPSFSSALYMSSIERDTKKTTKKKVEVMDRVETKAEEQKRKEEMWRVVLHNDEVHTFNYVVRSLTKVIGTLDRKAAFEICVQTHGIGKATITKTWKKQAEQFCLGLQRQGLTVSISPDEDFEGGHSGGGL